MMISHQKNMMDEHENTQHDLKDRQNELSYPNSNPKNRCESNRKIKCPRWDTDMSLQSFVIVYSYGMRLMKVQIESISR